VNTNYLNTPDNLKTESFIQEMRLINAGTTTFFANFFQRIDIYKDRPAYFKTIR